jgi:hypothetical protein
MSPQSTWSAIERIARRGAAWGPVFTQIVSAVDHPVWR